MKDYNASLMLFQNLLSRLSYNEKQRLWKLEGPISEREREALRDAEIAFQMMLTRGEEQK